MPTPNPAIAVIAQGAILPIADSDVHRITSGQVVLDLQTAVKELVENALDAGSTNIAIHFKDYGFDSFEVVDNGSGLDPSNYASVALKHYTSKLASFSDLAMVRTFGFRGEALSSLCALAEVSIHTATQEDAPIGTLLQLKQDGNVADSGKKAARQRGTTITIAGLFKSLPVRRKEFEKNLKREYNKAQNLLQAYALITKGVRWSTSNFPKGGRRTPQFSVNSSSGENYLYGNVASLFGAKVTPTLMPLALDLTFSTNSNSVSKAEGVNVQETSSVRVEGLISKPTYGSGRTSSDRQFYFINGRPWDAGRVSRAVNEVYKSFNTNQLPFVIANFKLPTDSYDVNVSPDKRTIFLHEESRLIEKIREGLDTLFSPSRATFLVNGASSSLRSNATSAVQSRLAQSTVAQSIIDRPDVKADVAEADDAEADDAEADDAVVDVVTEDANTEDDLDTAASKRTQALGDALEYREDSSHPLVDDDDSSEPEILHPVNNPGPDFQAEECSADDGSDSQMTDMSKVQRSSSKRLRTSLQNVHPHERLSSEESTGSQVIDTSYASWSPSKRQRTTEIPRLTRIGRFSNDNVSRTRLSLSNFVMPGSKVPSTPEEVAVRMDVGLNEDTVLSSSEDACSPILAPEAVVGDEIEETDVVDNLSRHTAGCINSTAEISEQDGLIYLNVSTLRSRLSAQGIPKSGGLTEESEAPAVSEEERNLLDNAGIDSVDEAQVERTLSRVMHKSDFEKMKVVGQFNLGFIIARRQSEPARDNEIEMSMDDLFIVDQHASDEKYNFEQLQETTRIQSQELIVPRSLELSASDELVAIEHQATLSKNGFEISILESGLPGTRIKLLSQPISKTTVFGVNDLEELLYLLRDVSPDSESARAIRCSKARSMFASRACRKSIMIGTALRRSRMASILKNMGTIEQPWNCPHGRPTMRHLVCLKTQDRQSYIATRDDVKEDQLALMTFMKQ